MKTVIVLSASSDIGGEMASRFLDAGYRVLGTVRQPNALTRKLKKRGAILIPVDLTDEHGIEVFTSYLSENNVTWSTFVSAPATLLPIGLFFETDIDEWEQSVMLNSTAQLRFLHSIYPYRDQSTELNVVFFAGGGTNGGFDRYSAYCLGKILLIKACELIHCEYPMIKTTIIGPGWVRTKGHLETLSAGQSAGTNLARTIEFLNSDQAGTDYNRIFKCVMWCVESEAKAVGGRNISLVHDHWDSHDGGRDLLSALSENEDLFRLRRLQDHPFRTGA